MSTTSYCQYLEWDSSFFKRRIARLTERRLNSKILDAVQEWCETNTIDCLYFEADPSDVCSIRAAEENAFRLTDVRVTFERSIVRSPAVKNTGATLRLSRPADIPALKTIAKNAHRNSRFYGDCHLPDSLCDALYETWIEKSCRGWADAVVVAEVRQEAVGYVSCHLLEQERGKIGLVGVKPDARGCGLGQNIVKEALSWFASQGVTLVTVATQGRNITSQRLYQRCGFLTQNVEFVYHRWF